jgi:hypothetical protein
MDITDSETAPLPKTAERSGADRERFRYELWSQASQDLRSRRAGVGRYAARDGSDDAHASNRTAAEPQNLGVVAAEVALP